jgi:hypothetical protein
MRIGLYAAIACAFMFVGCNERVDRYATTQVTLRIQAADAELAARLSKLNITMHREEGERWVLTSSASHTLTKNGWPVEVPILPRSDASIGKRFEAVVDGLSGGVRVTQARVISGYDRGSVRLLELTLYDCADGACAVENCHGESCGSCGESACQPVGVFNPGMLPVVESGEGGPDGGSELGGHRTDGGGMAGLDAGGDEDAALDASSESGLTTPDGSAGTGLDAGPDGGGPRNDAGSSMDGGSSPDAGSGLDAGGAKDAGSEASDAGGAADTSVDTAVAPPTNCLLGSGDFSALGPYTVVRSTVTIGAQGSYAIYAPDPLDRDCVHPIVAWANGTGVTDDMTYGFLQSHAASYGMVVVASLEPNAASGAFHIAGIDYLLQQGASPSSRYYQRLSTRAGTAGHSQGGAGAVAGSTHANVQAIVAIQAPASTNNGKSFLCLQGTAATASCKPAVDGAGTPAFFANWQGGDNITTPTTLGYMNNDPGTLQYRRLYTAWFRCQLANDSGACAMFKGGSGCPICADSGWATIYGRNF